jgi:hypothetical protein
MRRSLTPFLPGFCHADGPTRRAVCALILGLGTLLSAGSPACGGPSETPPRLEDRGGAIPTSQFGTYVSRGQFLVYPFYEYTSTGEAEYVPSELGFTGNQEFFGKLKENEALIFLAYGFSDRVALEFEAALWASAELTKAPEDPSGVPDHLKESGLGDVESQLRWVWSPETATRPLLYSFWEVVFPLQKSKVLLGTQDWETELGFGAVRGYGWGTINGRVSMKYDREDGQVEVGEYAFEYLKRTSPRWRWVASLEGEDDELSLIGEAQLTIGRHAFVKLNCGFGVTRKAPDFAPEVGILFTF